MWCRGKQKMNRLGNACLKLVGPVGLVCVPVVFFDWVGFVHRVDGVSMQPVLNPEVSRFGHDYVYASAFSAMNYNFKRGEIVTLISPRDPKEMMIKRVIGLPGDYVRSKNDKQYLIPKGYCWIEGDNPKRSADSNSFGPIPLGLIQTKVKYRVWPPSRAGKLVIKEPSHLKVSNSRDPNNDNLKPWYEKQTGSEF